MISVTPQLIVIVTGQSGHYNKTNTTSLTILCERSATEQVRVDTWRIKEYGLFILYFSLLATNQ